MYGELRTLKRLANTFAAGIVPDAPVISWPGMTSALAVAFRAVGTKRISGITPKGQLYLERLENAPVRTRLTNFVVGGFQRVKTALFK